MTDADGTVPPEVAEALLAVQRLVNDIVAKTVGAAALSVPPISGIGSLTASPATLSGTGTVELTPEHVEALRGYVNKAVAGGAVVYVAIEKMDVLASFAERMLGLLP